MRTIRVPDVDQRGLFLIALRRFFGDFNEGHLAKVLPSVGWNEYAAGELVIREGSDANELFFVVSGRLQVVTRSRSGEERIFGEMGRGEVFGEIALLTGTTRTANVFAIRPSLLASLPKAAFEALLADHPSLSMKLAGLIIERLHRANAEPSVRSHAPSSVALISLCSSLDVCAMAESLCSELPGASLISEAAWAQRFSAENDRGALDDPQLQLKVTRWLDDIETQHRYLLLAANTESLDWAMCCVRHADEVLLFVDSTQSASSFDVRTGFLESLRTHCLAVKRLVFVHQRGAAIPRGTAAWLERIDVSGHVHIRIGVDADMARLARIVSRKAVGLVLSGGGARGFAHLGVYKALVEAKIPIDSVAGTSMGAAIGAMIALEVPPDDALEECRGLFNARLVLDLNFLPLLSLLSGRRVKTYLKRLFSRSDGTSIDIEDSWRAFFCVASSYSRMRQVVLRQGSLDKLVRASLSMPVFMPPVIHGSEILLDGGLMNNFPTQEMRKGEVGLLIAVDLCRPRVDRIEVDDVPTTWRLVLDLIGRNRTGQGRLPSMFDILYNAPTLSSAASQIECARSADVLIQPELGAMGTLEWSALERAYEAGYAAARSKLNNLDGIALERQDDRLTPEVSGALGQTAYAGGAQP